MMPVSEIALREGLRTFGDEAHAGRDLGRFDGCADGAAHGERRNCLCRRPPRSEDRWTYGDRGTRAHAGLPPRRTATLPVRHWTVRPRKGAGGKFLVFRPGLGERAGRRFCRPLPNLFSGLSRERISIRGEDRSGGQSYQADKNLSVASTSSSALMEFLNGSPQDMNTVFPDNLHFSSYWRTRGRGTDRGLWPLERFQMQAIGIEKGSPSNPTIRRRRPSQRRPGSGEPCTRQYLCLAVSRHLLS